MFRRFSDSAKAEPLKDKLSSQFEQYSDVLSLALRGLVFQSKPVWLVLALLAGGLLTVYHCSPNVLSDLAITGLLLSLWAGLLPLIRAAMRRFGYQQTQEDKTRVSRLAEEIAVTYGVLCRAYAALREFQFSRTAEGLKRTARVAACYLVVLVLSTRVTIYRLVFSIVLQAILYGPAMYLFGFVRRTQFYKDHAPRVIALLRKHKLME